MEAKPKEEKEIEYHEQITDPVELKTLEDFKHSIATITDKKDKAVLDPFVLLDNDFLILFLRARKLNVKKATRMLMDYYHFKAKMNLDNLYSNYIFKEKYKLQLLFPHGFHKITKEGYPVYFQIMGKLNAEELFKLGTPDEITKYSVKIYEILERDYFKICSKLKNKYVHGVFNIIDFRNIKATSLLNKNLLSYIKETFKICQDYYPESLAGCYILNAGLAFRTFYSAVKVFLDSKTREKIKVFGENYKDGLLERIDADCLPTFFGGTCDCPGGCLFSNAGPWKKDDEKEEELPEDIIKGRQEMTNYMFEGLKNDNEEKVKNTGKGGINPDNL
jgi:hypothetical protein